MNEELESIIKDLESARDKLAELKIVYVDNTVLWDQIQRTFIDTCNSINRIAQLHNR